jgi:thymidine kinase
LIAGEQQLVVGDAGEYQVRCRACYEPPGIRGAVSETPGTKKANAEG